MTEKIKVFLVDDHPLVREGLSSLINQQPDMVVCGDAAEARSALRDIPLLQPDIAIVDLMLKGVSGLELIKSLKAKNLAVRIIVVSMYDERLYAERVIRAGACGYVMKSETPKKIVAAIRQVMEGKLYLSEEMAALFSEKFVRRPHTGSRSPAEVLSDRELEVFNLLGRGMSTRQVSELLNVNIKTVQSYCARIRQKLVLDSAVDLLHEAILWQESQIDGSL